MEFHWPREDIGPAEHLKGIIADVGDATANGDTGQVRAGGKRGGSNAGDGIRDGESREDDALLESVIADSDDAIRDCEIRNVAAIECVVADSHNRQAIRPGWN